MQRFCSKVCVVREYQYRSGLKQRREFGVCKNGHERTPENTRLRARDGHSTKVCRICERAMQKKLYDANPEKYRKLRRDRWWAERAAA